jgi:hypothetical protein
MAHFGNVQGDLAIVAPQLARPAKGAQFQPMGKEMLKVSLVALFFVSLATLTVAASLVPVPPSPVAASATVAPAGS